MSLTPLDPIQVAQIKKLLNEGISQRAISRTLGLSLGVVNKYSKKKSLEDNSVVIEKVIEEDKHTNKKDEKDSSYVEVQEVKLPEISEQEENYTPYHLTDRANKILTTSDNLLNESEKEGKKTIKWILEKIKFWENIFKESKDIKIKLRVQFVLTKLYNQKDSVFSGMIENQKNSAQLSSYATKIYSMGIQLGDGEVKRAKAENEDPFSVAALLVGFSKREKIK